MAKKENRHAEHFDKLSASLVSASANIDAPYELPEGWEWCRLPECVSIVTGKKDANYGTPDGKYLFFTCAEQPLRCDDYSFEGESLLLPGNGANVGQVIYYDGQFEVYQRTYILQKIIESFSLKYLYYHILGFWENYNHDKQYGSATNYIKMGNFLNYIFPLPPTLAEQQRIVNRIETMFAKLDEAKEKAQNVVDSFETRKAAILHKAFTGQLKIDNEELSIEDWEEKKLGEVCESIFDGDHMPPPKAESGIPFLVISNVNTGFLSFDNTRYVPNDYYDSLSETRKPKTGDVLYTIVGSYGIPVLVDSDRAFCFQRHMALLKPSKLISSRYLWYVLQSNEMYQKATSIATGTAQLTVPIKGLRDLTISVPPLNYQLSIVNFLDTVLEKETRAKEAAQTVLEQIALLKKSILARAFRGEL